MSQAIISAKDGAIVEWMLEDMVKELGEILPGDWDRQIIHAVVTDGVHVKKEGKGPGSLEEEETAGLDYVVLSGTGVRKAIPWMWELYKNHKVEEYMSSMAGELVRSVPEEEAACINVNLVRGMGGRYEWHTDADPYTLMLYVTTHAPNEGGQLAWLTDTTKDITRDTPGFVLPLRGKCALFDGQRHPHAVMPLRMPGIVRVSMPMHYRPKNYTITRDKSLDNYLFSGETKPDASDQ